MFWMVLLANVIPPQSLSRWRFEVLLQLVVLGLVYTVYLVLSQWFLYRPEWQARHWVRVFLLVFEVMAFVLLVGCGIFAPSILYVE